VSALRRRARLLSGHVTAANVPDNNAAHVQLASPAAARLLLDEGLEPVLTLQCRDRNRLALQADLLGAAALGVRNVLCLSGDTPDPANAAQPVFDLDSVGLLQAIAALGQGRLLDDSPLRGTVRLVSGAAAHPFEDDPERRIGRLQAKVGAGARFLQTQYVFDVAAFARWLEELRGAGLGGQVAVIASVGPLRSQRVLGFLRALPGVRIPEGVEQRFAGLTEQRFAEESLRLCAETARALAALPGVAGIHVMAPYWEEEIANILVEAGIAGRLDRA
jgi:methylenetetrahydrofolate reductase (NADPH)